MSVLRRDPRIAATRTLRNAVRADSALVGDHAIPIRCVAGFRRSLRVHQRSGGDYGFLLRHGGGDGGGRCGRAKEGDEEGDSDATGVAVYERFRSTTEAEDGGGGRVGRVESGTCVTAAGDIDSAAAAASAREAASTTFGEAAVGNNTAG